MDNFLLSIFFFLLKVFKEFAIFYYGGKFAQIKDAL